MEGGCASSAGSSRSRAASTAARSCSKNAGGFISWRVCPAFEVVRLGLLLASGIEWFRSQFAASFLQKNFHFSLGLFQMLLAIARELHAFLEQFHGVVERKIVALQLSYDLFQARQRMLEIGLFGGLRFFRRCLIHGCHFL